MDLKLCFNNICRICMKKELGMLSIFDNASRSISDKVMYCSTIKVDSGDGLPTQICKTCFSNLDIAYKFKELCEKSDMTLRKRLQDIAEPEYSDSTCSSSDYEIEIKEEPTDEDNNKPKNVTQQSQINSLKLTEVEDKFKLRTQITVVDVNPSSNTSAKVNDDLVTIAQQELNDFDLARVLEEDFKCYICEICGKGFDTKANLKAHVRRHEDLRPFKCETCQKCFRERSTLKVHMRCHTGEKPFACKICFKTFTQNSSLKSHTRSHTHETPYKCEICGRLFTALSNYSKHYRAHKNERKYVCGICGAAFNFNHGLKKHSMIHTGERPYSCTICNKAFMRQTNLKTHMRIHNGETPYSCEVCFKSFRYNSVLKGHLKSKHDIIVPPTLPLAEFHL